MSITVETKLQLCRVTLDWNPDNAEEGDYSTNVWAEDGDQAIALVAGEMADASADQFDTDKDQQDFIARIISGAGPYAVVVIADSLSTDLQELLAGPTDERSSEAAADYAQIMEILAKYGVVAPGTDAEALAATVPEPKRLKAGVSVPVDAICSRLLDSEEHAGEAAIPDVAEDAVELIRQLSAELGELESEKQALVSQRDEALGFVEQVANLRIWGFDKDDGSPYQETEEPDDGCQDSHDCLMALIEKARTF